MEIQELLISSLITIFSLGLLIISFISYRKHKNTRLLFITIILVVLLIKGILYSLSLFYPSITLLHSLLYSIYGGLFDLLILILLFIATLKR